MKTTATLILSLITVGLAFAGPKEIVTETGPPAPAPSLFGTGFQLAVFGDGLWTTSNSSIDRYFRTDKAFGGSALGTYFFTPNLGAGIGFGGYAVKNTIGPGFGSDRRFVGDAVLSLTYRYPIGAFAPYVRLAGGGIFNGGNKSVKEPTGTPGKLIKFEIAEHDAKLLAQPAAGVEFKFSPAMSIFAEGIFNKIDRPHSNSVGARAGVGYSF
jgi:hypothetical protein